MPGKRSKPYLGKENAFVEVIRERIEIIFSQSVLRHVLKEMNKAHFYEETVMGTYPIYEIGRKKAQEMVS